MVIPSRWRRINYRGRAVDLRSGPALAAALVVSAAVGGFFRPAAVRPEVTRSVAATRSDWLVRAGAVAAIGAAGAVGLVDDLCGDASARGLAGHLGALRKGQVTTGVVKILGIGAGALSGAMLAGAADHTGITAQAGPGRSIERTSLTRRLVDAGLIAASANLINLLDLRPGRALKAAIGPSLALCFGRDRVGATTAAAVIGAAIAAAPGDLGERTMLGDAGACALGAAIGFAANRQLKTPLAVATLAGLTGLTIASEKVSFSAVITRHRLLAKFDAWGRRL